MAQPRTIETNERAYERLEAVANILTAYSKKGIRYWVDDTYFDYGQGWKWTTILAKDGEGWKWQAICPRDWELIIEAETPEELMEAVNSIRNDKFFGDK